MGKLWVGGAFGIAGVLAFILTLSISMLLFGGYDPAANYMSDLGAGGAYPQLFNVGLMVSGFLGAAFGFYLLASPGKSRRNPLLSACISLIGVGAFPENFAALHFAFSAAFFLLAAISMFVACAESRGHAFRTYSAFSGLLALAFLAMRMPIMEHAAALAAAGWVAYYAARFVAENRNR